ncbi:MULTISPECIES: hypothetical protein [unclassified Pseudoalteromonas]|uniref:hypothetical protein n=1 Tax=unclassified Pseudoalteromonas TaxID=194690 RepID=UPI0025B5E2E1|nr:MULTISPECIES: hypothetical protein [unclassified Pseudoalteromonas]MDN3378967.1 hypothetical protein [Pseudoalteromonas sp. APC 3893]MDN3387613.1 hypothetical protein [Pseudoalteromonas sp. APC 4017]
MLPIFSLRKKLIPKRLQGCNRINMNTLKKTFLCSLFVLPCLAQAVDIAGKVGAQSRFFIHDEKLQSSLLAEPEVYWSDEERRNSFTFKLFARYDALDDERTHLDIREAIWLHVGDSWEFRAGIGKTFWGVTESNHLVDVINQTDLVESIDGEEKLGQPMLQGTILRDWGVVSAFVLPGFRDRTFPGIDGRLTGQIVIDTHNPLYEDNDKKDHFDYALRYTNSIDIFDFGLSWFKGTNRDPHMVYQSLENNIHQPSATPLYDQMQQFGVDAQATIGNWLWKIEAIARDDSIGNLGAFTAGFEYTMVGFVDITDLGLLMEYNRNSRNERSPSSLQNDIFVGARLAFNDVQSSQLLIGYTQDLTESSSKSAFIEGSRRLGESWKLTLDVRLFTADNPTMPLYGIRNEDYGSVTLEYYF